MKRVDKPSKHRGKDLLNIKENSEFPCNLLSLSELPERSESIEALFCSDVSEDAQMFQKGLQGDKT